MLREAAGSPRRRLRNIVGGSAANLVEWFESYAYWAFALYFVPVFFPKGDATGQLLNTAAIFAVGFVMRPIGAARHRSRFHSLHPPDNEANPWPPIARIPPQLPSQPVISGYSMGGPLMLAGIDAYVDGRGVMYGDELVMGYVRLRPGTRTRSRRRSGAERSGASVGRFS